MKTLELKIPPLLLAVIIGLAMYPSSLFFPMVEINPVVKLVTLMVVLFVAAYFLLFGVLEFRRHKTTVDPRYPENTSSLVDTGVYAISRNPMYVGFALFLVSLIVFLESPLLILGVIGFVSYMNRFQIKPEEKLLTELFGDSYIEYKTKVHRWL